MHCCGCVSLTNNFSHPDYGVLQAASHILRDAIYTNLTFHLSRTPDRTQKHITIQICWHLSGSDACREFLQKVTDVSVQECKMVSKQLACVMFACSPCSTPLTEAVGSSETSEYSARLHDVTS